MLAHTLGIALIAEAVAESDGEDNILTTGGSQSLMFALGMLLMVSLLTRSVLRAYRRSRRKSPFKAVRKAKAEADQHEPRKDLPLYDAPAVQSRWHAEVNDIARSTEAEIETKLRRLQATIRLADQSADRLERAVERYESLRDHQADANVRQRVVHEERPAQADPPTPSSREGKLQMQDSMEVAPDAEPRKRESTEDEMAFPEVQGDSYDSQLQAIEEWIWELATESMTSRQIADLTGVPIGDVELILSTGNDSPSEK